MNERNPADLSEDLLLSLARVDADLSQERDNGADRTSADVMRDCGFSEAEIKARFGYLPSPIIGSSNAAALFALDGLDFGD